MYSLKNIEKIKNKLPITNIRRKNKKYKPVGYYKVLLNQQLQVVDLQEPASHNF
jgi:hypothetical protein